MKKINIPLKENSYQVLIGKNILSETAKEIVKKKLFNSILIVIDGNVNRLYGSEIKKVFSSYRFKINYFVLKPGEASKSPETLHKIYNFLIARNYGRDSLIVAIGGGVTGDISGYAAATFMRGIQFLQVPTTLLAAVDSSVGGKTGINFGHTKNIIGAFYQPKSVITDISFINTLPEKELLCGLGEVLKYAFISDTAFFSFIDKNAKPILERNEAVLAEVIAKCVSIKAAVVSEDEKETGIRKILNLGHTFAHSYESALDYSIKHGAAVIIGLACAVILSHKLGLIDYKLYTKFSALIKRFHPGNKFIGLNKTTLYNIMLHDKKNRNGRIRFVLPVNIGEISIDHEAQKEDVLYTLKEAENFF